MMNKLTLGIGLALASNSAMAADWLHCGNVFDSEAGELRGAHYIQVADGEISGLQKNRPDAEQIIDLSDSTCLPGLIDMHVHLDGQSGPQDRC